MLIIPGCVLQNFFCEENISLEKTTFVAILGTIHGFRTYRFWCHILRHFIAKWPILIANMICWLQNHQYLMLCGVPTPYPGVNFTKILKATFSVRKFCGKLFCTFILGLSSLCANITAQKPSIICWWNWPLRFHAHRQHKNVNSFYITVCTRV